MTDGVVDVTELVGQIAILSDRRSPIDGARIVSLPAVGAWGYHRPPTERHAAHIHAGVDVHGAPGTAVRAPEAGTIEAAGMLPARPPWTDYAPAVMLRGASGRWHLLAHLNGTATGGHAEAPAVSVGQVVRLGDVLGYTGPRHPLDPSHAANHTHWEVRTRPRARRAEGETTFTITVDPVRWLAGEDVPIPDPLLQGPPLDPQRPAHRWRRVERVAALPRSLSSSSSSPSRRDAKPRSAER